MEDKEQKTARLFKALGDPNRIIIVEMLQCGDKCACELLSELKVEQPTLSHHMRILCNSGLVDSRKEGRWVHYRLNEPNFSAAVDTLRNLSKLSANAQAGDKCAADC